MQKKKQIAVLGYGVVGSGVVELFYQNQEKIEKNTGYSMDIKYILDLRTFEGDPYADKVVHDINVILQDPEVGYVAECMGGVNPAFEFVSSCLKAGKSVSTSNKQLVAEKGDILLQIAKENNCNFFFEASVGGAIPIMRPLHTCLAANDLYAVAGILNGTTNFILEKMFWLWLSSWAMQNGILLLTLTVQMPAEKSALFPLWYLVSTFIRTVSLQRAFGIFSWKMSSWLSSWAVQ